MTFIDSTLKRVREIERIINEYGEYDYPIKELGMSYIEALIYFSNNKASCSDIFDKTTELLKVNHGKEIRCGVEMVELIKLLKYVGGDENEYPHGFGEFSDYFVEKYSKDEEVVRIGKIINHLEKSIGIEEDDKEIIYA